MATACVALGSNLGDRAANLRSAARALAAAPGVAAGVRRLRMSGLYETEPVGGPAGQPSYLNAAAVLETTLPPGDLLATLMRIEREHGRDRAREERNGPRTLDLDLLLYNGEVIDQPGLVVPHPRMHQRRFVLEPLAEIAPDAVHPVLRETVAELLRELEHA